MAKKFVDIIVQAKDKTRAAFKSVDKGLARLKESVLSFKGAIVGAIGVAGIIRLGKTFLGAAGRQEAAVESLRAALERAGETSRGAVKDFEEFAAGIQKITVIGDEAVLELAAMGASMAKLTGQELKDATVAAIGLSRVFRLEVVAAMRLVARAAAGDTGSLSRYGITLDATLSKQEKFNEVLRIGKEGFVLAEKEVDTFNGTMMTAGNTFSDVGEQLGRVLQPHIVNVTKALKEQAEQMKKMSDEEMKELGDRGIRLAKILAGIWVISRVAESLVALFGGIAFKAGVATKAVLAFGAALGAVGAGIVAAVVLPVVLLNKYQAGQERITEGLVRQMKLQGDLNDRRREELRLLSAAETSAARLSALEALRVTAARRLAMLHDRLRQEDFGDIHKRNLRIIIAGTQERRRELSRQIVATTILIQKEERLADAVRATGDEARKATDAKLDALGVTIREIVATGARIKAIRKEIAEEEKRQAKERMDLNREVVREIERLSLEAISSSADVTSLRLGPSTTTMASSSSPNSLM